METKACTVCGEVKPLDQYRKYSGRGKLGLRPLCKVCQREYEKTWRSKSTEARKATRAKRSQKAKIYSREYRAKNRAAYLIAECRRRSQKKGFAFDLDAYVPQMQERISKGTCEVSGIALALEAAPGRAYNTPSLDRIDPSKGYVYGNVRIVAFAVNAMLGDWGEEVAMSIIAQWLKNKV